ncbi:MAG: hypothetical protein OEZ58_16605 [Gammaproteobacteria bacterium]|nr:hypothetical protein [Gammaproteobacteria bacterium]
MSTEKKHYTLEELRKMRGRTDIEAFEKLTDKEIKEQILADPDTPNLSEDELKEFDFPKERERKHDDKNE